MKLVLLLGLLSCTDKEPALQVEVALFHAPHARSISKNIVLQAPMAPLEQVEQWVQRNCEGQYPSTIPTQIQSPLTITITADALYVQSHQLLTQDWSQPPKTSRPNIPPFFDYIQEVLQKQSLFMQHCQDNDATISYQPLLLIMDQRTNQIWLRNILYTLAIAGIDEVALLVDNPNPLNKKIPPSGRPLNSDEFKNLPAHHIGHTQMVDLHNPILTMDLQQHPSEMAFSEEWNLPTLSFQNPPPLFLKQNYPPTVNLALSSSLSVQTYFQYLETLASADIFCVQPALMKKDHYPLPSQSEIPTQQLTLPLQLDEEFPVFFIEYPTIWPKDELYVLQRPDGIQCLFDNRSQE